MDKNILEEERPTVEKVYAFLKKEQDLFRLGTAYLKDKGSILCKHDRKELKYKLRRKKEASQEVETNMQLIRPQVYDINTHITKLKESLFTVSIVLNNFLDDKEDDIQINMKYVTNIFKDVTINRVTKIDSNLYTVKEVASLPTLTCKI